MAKTNTRKYIIYGSIATIVGVIGYYIWKSSKKDEKPKDETPAPDNDGKEKDGKVNETPVKDKGNVGTSASTTKNPFITTTELDLFQTWVYNVKNDKNILGASKIDGLWGDASAAAWDKYGEEWKKYRNPEKPSVTTPVKSKPKVYAMKGAYIFSTLTDIVPYRMTTSHSEYVGESLGIVEYNGAKYYKLAWDRGEVKYMWKWYATHVVN